MAEIQKKSVYVYSGDHRRIAYQELHKEKKMYVFIELILYIFIYLIGIKISKKFHW